MLDGLPAIRIAQPWRGLVLIGVAGAFAVRGFALYAALAHGRFAPAPSSAYAAACPRAGNSTGTGASSP